MRRAYRLSPAGGRAFHGHAFGTLGARTACETIGLARDLA